MNKSIFAITIFALFFLFGCNNKSDHSSNYPNIVYILADDLGYGDLSGLNPESKIQTPNLDRLAKQGLTFTEAHSGSAVCTPTRYGILTGRYAWRTKLRNAVLWPYDPPLIRQEKLTVAEMLQQKGYETACIGKWHLGWNWQLKNGSSVKDSITNLRYDRAYRSRIEKQVNFDVSIEEGPITHGFDYYFGDDVPNFPPYSYIENDRVLSVLDTVKPPNVHGNPGLMTKGWNMADVMPTITEKSVEYISNKSKNNRPFFLYFSLTAPHTPIAPNEKFTGSSEAGLYGDFVQEVDWTVGQIMKALEENGIEENTLLIFTSDNGSPARDGTDMAGPVRSVLRYNHNPSHHFRGMKADIWEGGHHVPFLVRWPKIVKPGSSTDQIICHTDFMATCAAIVDYDLGNDDAEDSYNILSLLQNPLLSRPIREATIHHSVNGSFAVRKGNWKYILTAGSGGWSSPNHNQAIKEGLPETQLYNLKNDISEEKNVVNKYPKIADSLTAILREYKTSGRSTPLNESKHTFAEKLEFIGKAVEEDGFTIWGSSPIMDDKGKVHLFVARWPCELKVDPGWRSHSEIAHYVGDSPEGPFTFSEVALKGTAENTWDKFGMHNPAIHKVGSKYVLLYIANNNPKTPPHSSNQCIGMAISSNLSGPWEKVGTDGKILAPPTDSTYWNFKSSSGVTNPAFLQMPDGRFFLYFKSEGGKMGLAISRNLEGPYLQRKTPVTQNSVAIEDGYAFLRNGEVTLLTTDNHGIIQHGGGMLWTSADGYTFDTYEQGFKHINEYTDVDMDQVKVHYGPQSRKYAKFERPQMLIIDGSPAYLYLPSGTNIYGGDCTICYILKVKE